MHQAYEDIQSKLGTPEWWDECGVPRYVEFHPRRCANIYATEVVLLDIKCQACGHPFLVAMSQSMADRAFKRDWGQPHCFPPHYGDPPRLLEDCCPPGPTMNVDFVRVRERWVRDRSCAGGWRRVQRFEFEPVER